MEIQRPVRMVPESSAVLADLPVRVHSTGLTAATRDGVRDAPAEPGCYIWRDRDGSILYTGKSVALRTRLANYFAPGRERKAGIMAKRATTVEWYVTGSEVEALILESTLIKRFQPPYNVQLRAYPHYTFLRFTDPGNDGVPYLELTKGIDPDGRAYFGPFWDRASAEQTRDFVNRLFALRQCEGRLPTAREGQSCFHAQVHRCQAPCMDVRELAPDRYAPSLADATALMRGDASQLIARLDAERDRASTDLRFERASELHQMASALRTLHGKRRHLRSAAHTPNFVVIVRGGSGVAARRLLQVLAFSGARLQGQFAVDTDAKGRDATARRATLTRFLRTHYPTARPLDIDLAELDQMHVVASWLARHGRSAKYVALPDGAVTTETARPVVSEILAAISAAIAEMPLAPIPSLPSDLAAAAG
ncbi:MAG: GIY-YIG nuclease family protein [Chloroflexi bacterium]|nr:GIY-YIG nuclease family protein [Chloroflexota bacterium]